MPGLLRCKAQGFLLAILDWFSTVQSEGLLGEAVARRANVLPSDEALCFLFRLDGRLYTLEGTKAVEYGSGIHTKDRHMRYHDFFVERISRGERVLGIGCGIGAVAHEVALKTGACVVGIDLDPNNIAKANKDYAHPRVEYRVGDVLKKTWNRYFDVVILSNILEHLPERSAFLRRVQEGARPSRFLIRVPLFERDWRVSLKQELSVEWRLDPGHETEYTVESFSEEMTAAGFFVSYKDVRWGEIWAGVRQGG